MTRPDLQRAEIASERIGVDGPTATRIGIRGAKLSDLEQVNAVNEQAIMTWDLPAQPRRSHCERS